jgi:hypothetical protein
MTRERLRCNSRRTPGLPRGMLAEGERPPGDQQVALFIIQSLTG